MVPGRDDLFLVNPDGWAFAEITASKLLICDFNRHVVAGDGVPEDTAFYIHARLHMRLPRARAAKSAMSRNGGQTRMSTWAGSLAAPATILSSLVAEAASPFIFQLPAISGRRTMFCPKPYARISMVMTR